MTSPHRELSVYLSQLADALANKRSREHAHLRILAAAARMLNERRFSNIRVPEVCAACGIARPTFYIHFAGWEPLYVELMHEMTKMEYENVPDTSDCASAEDAVLRIVDWYVEMHRHNLYLFANLTFLRGENEVLLDAWKFRVTELHAAMTKALQRFDEFRLLDPTETQYMIQLYQRAMNVSIYPFELKQDERWFLPIDLEARKRLIARSMYRSLFCTEPRRKGETAGT